MAEEYRGRAEAMWDDTLHRVRSFHDDSKQYVRENPTKAVLTALGVGFVLGIDFPSLGNAEVDGCPASHCLEPHRQALRPACADLICGGPG